MSVDISFFTLLVLCRLCYQVICPHSDELKESVSLINVLNVGFGRAGLFVDLTSNRNHTLYVDGLLKDGSVVSRSRSFYTGKDVCNVWMCMVYYV